MVLMVWFPVELSTLGNCNVRAVNCLFSWGVGESPVEGLCSGSDFLKPTKCPVFAEHSRKSRANVLTFEILGFELPLGNPLPCWSPERLGDTGGVWAFTATLGLLLCWLRTSHWEIFSLILMRCSLEGGLPDWGPCQATVAPFCSRSTSPHPASIAGRQVEVGVSTESLFLEEIHWGFPTHTNW